jgi:hypothetical protein
MGSFFGVIAACSISFLPDLTACLDDLLRTRERLAAARELMAHVNTAQHNR